MKRGYFIINEYYSTNCMGVAEKSFVSQTGVQLPHRQTGSNIISDDVAPELLFSLNT